MSSTTGPHVVIRCGSAYPDAVVERLASEVTNSGLSVRIEDFDLAIEAVDTSGLLALELSDGASGALLTEPMRTTVAAVVDAAQRRRRRQEAAGEERDVGVIINLSDDVQVIVPIDADPNPTDGLLTALAGWPTAETPGSGIWLWNPSARRLDRASAADDPLPDASGR
jgi:hypothetical protein